MTPTPFYPVFLDLRGRACLVVGAGAVAAAKVRGLLEAGADVTIVAPEATDTVRAWSDEGRVAWVRRAFHDADLVNQWLVIAATDDPAVNATIFAAAERRHLLVNAVDDLRHSTVIAPAIAGAIARAGAVQVAVTTGGQSPALAKRLRDRIQSEILSGGQGRLAALLGAWRPAVKQTLAGYARRQAFWEGVLESCVPALAASGDVAAANHALGEALRRATSPELPENPANPANPENLANPENFANSENPANFANPDGCARGWS